MPKANFIFDSWKFDSIPYLLLFTGGISFHQQDPSNPLIQTILVPLHKKSDFFVADFAHTEPNRFRTVGELPALIGGTIWETGSLIRGTMKVKNLEIKKKMSFNNLEDAFRSRVSTPPKQISELRMLELKNSPSHPIWELREGSYEKDSQLQPKTNCLELKVSNAPSLLIPMGEVIRFFFTGSSVLARQVVQQGVQAENLWLPNPPSIFDKVTKVCRVSPRPDFSEADIFIMAWWLSDKTAYTCALKISNHLKSLSATGMNASNYLYPVARLPFSNGTPITLVGDILRISIHGKEYWLMLRIRQCQFESPYSALEIYREEVFHVSNGIDNLTSKVVTVGKKMGNEVSRSLTLGSARGTTKPQRLQIHTQSKFPGLKTVEVKEIAKNRVAIRPTKKREKKFKPKSPVSSTGKPGGRNGAEPVVIDLEFMFRIVDELVKLGKGLKETISAQRVTIGNSTADLFSIFPQPRDNRLAERWALINQRPRRAIIYKITYRNRCFYFMDGERKSTESFCMLLFMRIDGKAATYTELNIVLAQCAVNLRVGYDEDQVPEFARPQRVLHLQGENPQRAARRVFDHIKSTFKD